MPPSKYDEAGFNPDDLSIKVSEMLVATADTSDELIDDSARAPDIGTQVLIRAGNWP